jgi:hypothetical protein
VNSIDRKHQWIDEKTITSQSTFFFLRLKMSINKPGKIRINLAGDVMIGEKFIN